MLASSLKAALLAGAVAGFAAAAYAEDPQVVTPGQPQQQVSPPASNDQLQRQLADQAAQLRAQGEQIQALTEQLRELTAIMSNRVDRIDAATDSGKVIATNPGPRIEAPNARHSMTFIGAAQVDAGAVRQTAPGPAAPDVHSGTNIRRARLGVQGTAFNDFAYQVEFDLTGTGGVAAGTRDVYVQYNGFRPFSITAGNVKPQTGMETTFSDRSNAATFIENSMLSSMIQTTGTRNVGVRVGAGGEHWSTSVGWFGDDINNNGVATPGEEGEGVHVRATWAPIAKPTQLLHVGVSGFDRTIGTDSTEVSQIRVRAQPESAIDAARLIDTGNIALAENARFIGLESAGFWGPVGFQSEWGQMEIDRTGRPKATFDGAYVNANWMLTGESRVYDPRTGVFTRFTPKTNVSFADHTYGAWEVAARWSTLDLNSDPNLVSGNTLLGIRGGEETDYTLGLNWYWNPYFRIMLNYVHADAEHRTSALPGIGVDAGTTLDLVGLRLQQEW